MTDYTIKEVRDMRKFMIAAGLSVAMATAGIAASQDATPQGLSQQDGLKAMRIVMSAQANAPFGKQGFGMLSDLVAGGGLSLQITSVDSSSATLMDYTLRVNRSDDRRHYSASLTPIKGCGPAWFGDDQNLIYTGKMLGC